MGQHHPRGWGFFLSVTATRAVRFFQPMDARWCCSNTVFQALAVVIVESRFILLSVSQSINCAASSERTIAIILYMFLVHLFLSTGEICPGNLDERRAL